MGESEATYPTSFWLSPTVKAKLREVRAAMRKEKGRAVTYNEVFEYLIDHWENT